MAIHDFRKLSADADLQADVCIIGSGPAGWTVADELRDSGLSVLVLESGGALESGFNQYDPRAEALNTTMDTGQPLFNGRRRTLGGTTESAGWANRTIAFDAIDYEQRPWVAHSGWPIDADIVAPFLDRAAVQLGVDSPLRPAPRMPHRSVWPSIDLDQLAPVTWTFGQSAERQVMRYGRLFRTRPRPNLRVLVHATVTQILVNADGTHVEAVEIASLGGKHAKIPARTVVLATGGIENPRILLYSDRTASAGLGNAHGLVGRYLMDHPRDLDMAVAFDAAEADRLRAIFGPFRLDSGAGMRFVTNGFAHSVARQRREGLLNTAGWFIEEAAEDDPIEAAKRLVRRQGTPRNDAAAVAKNAGVLLRATYGRLAQEHALHRKAGKIGLVIGSEQQPDADSRVTLAAATDRFGLPLAQTHWRIGALERASQATLANTVAREFLRLGLPTATLAEWVRDNAPDRAPLVDGCHPTGTTRMSNDPRDGVVDVNCQVHGIAGLYVAGSSIFPTAGHANPTLMIAALAARLADHLARSLKRSDRITPNATPTPESDRLDDRRSYDGQSQWIGQTVAITGASGFLGERVVEMLVDAGARVVCLIRRPPGQRLRHLGVETRVVNLADIDAVRGATADVDYIFHCAYDWADEEWNRRALAALIDVGRAKRLKRLVHVSSFVVYDLPPSGDLVEESLETTAPSGYARIKLDLETMLLAAVHAGDLEAAIVQPTLVYGPRSQPWTIDPLDKLTHGKVVLPDKGEGACNAVFVDDVVQAMLLAARARHASGERFLISGDPVSWSSFYETLARVGSVHGPVYLAHDTIVAKNQTVARLLRGLLTPRLLARKIAGVGLVRRTLVTRLSHRSARIRAITESRLYGPIARLPGHTHLPDIGELAFLESSATVGAVKARRLLGYAPRFDLATGMGVTGANLPGRRSSQ